MKRMSLLLAIAMAGVFVFAGLSFAQPRGGMMWRGSGGWGPGSQYNRIYDPKSLETISGEVTSMDRITPYQGMSGGNSYEGEDRQRNGFRPSWSELVSREPRREDRAER